MMDQIPVAAPKFVGNEAEYVQDCIETTWISSKGKYIDRFEDMFAEFCGTDYAVSCSNGTAGLHLALAALDIGPGDEVIIPDLTFVSTANAVRYCGAEPVLADIEPGTWNIDPEHVEKLVTEDTTAIIPVHLYGHPVDMDPILDIADDHDVAVVEDAAEAHGGEYKGERTGSIGHVGVFSFYGNKIVTTGEGGMVVTDDADVAERLTRLKDLWMDQEQRYYFPKIGFNYRMTNLQAAVGCAQMEKIGWHLERRREVATSYHERLRDIAAITRPVERKWANHAYWMYSILVPDGPAREETRAGMAEKGIETRPFFHPMSSLPPYRNNGDDRKNKIAPSIARCGLNLPTWAGLEEDHIDRVCTALRNIVE